MNGSNLTYWSVRKDGLHALNLSDFLAKACEFGIGSILVEGGSRLATSFIQSGLVDKYVVFVAPKILGKGKDAVGDLAIRKLADAIEFERSSFETCGRDVVFIGYPRGKK
jgi:riboflavin biosynthesis pyrimidine reductase